MRNNGRCNWKPLLNQELYKSTLESHRFWMQTPYGELNLKHWMETWPGKPVGIPFFSHCPYWKTAKTRATNMVSKNERNIYGQHQEYLLSSWIQCAAQSWWLSLINSWWGLRLPSPPVLNWWCNTPLKKNDDVTSLAICQSREIRVDEQSHG